MRILSGGAALLLMMIALVLSSPVSTTHPACFLIGGGRMIVNRDSQRSAETVRIRTAFTSGRCIDVGRSAPAGAARGRADAVWADDDAGAQALRNDLKVKM
jgi:hypothetical protein